MISIGLTGDVMIGRLVAQTSCENPWGDTLPLLHSTDLNLINLETTLTNSKMKVQKVFNFKAPPDHIERLKQAHITVANLANNHSLDYSKEGLWETTTVLDQAGIAYVGAGSNPSLPLILTVNDFKIGIIGATDNEPSWKKFINYIEINDQSLRQLKKLIIPLREKIDILIISIHWGPNMRQYPPEEFQKFARELVNYGVDLVHGHSAHIFQGVEIYRKGIILYDTGDFIDDYIVDPDLRNDQSFFFVTELNHQGTQKLILYPTQINNCKVNLAQGAEKEAILTRMEKLSEKMGTHLIRKEHCLLWEK